MSRVHVYLADEEKIHHLESGDCFCEPQILDEGLDTEGERALVFVHQQTTKRRSKMTVRAKFRLDSIKITPGSRQKEGNTYESCKNHELEFNAVYQGSEENKKFFNSTPSGKLTMSVVNEEAMTYLEIGQEYYLDFTKAVKV